MNLLALKAPIHQVRNNQARGVIKTLHYTINLSAARVRDYNYSLLIPEGTITLERVESLLQKDWDVKEFNISFTQKQYMNEFNSLKIKKQVNTGLIKTHPFIQEILTKTPIHHDNKLINDSLELIKLSKEVQEYESIIPHNLISDYLTVKQHLSKIKPVNTEKNLLALRNGVYFNGPSINEFKKRLRVKHWTDNNIINFTKSFYTLGPLAKLCLNLDDLWNH